MEKKLELLKKALPGRVYERPAERYLYAYDATPIPIKRELPAAVVFPESAQEVKKLVEVCYEEEIPLFPRGAGTGLTGGAVPTDGRGVVVSFERMTGLTVRPEDGLAVAEPGVITEKLQKEAERYGLFYPPDPSSYKYSTLGGNVAENAGGPRCLKYGTTRDYVLELETVIKEGELLKTGGPVIKDVAGYDLTRLLVGSEGTLGLFTRITVKLIPKPPARLTLLALFDDLASMGKAVTRLLSGGVFPSALEFMDRDAIRAVKQFKPLELPEVEALLLVELDGWPAALKQEALLAEKLLKEEGARVRRASNAKESEELWLARKSLGPALGRIKSGKINEDVVLPRSAIAEALPLFKEVGRKYGLEVVVFGHVGDGNLHVNLLYEKEDPEQERRAEEAVNEVFEIALSFNGSITGEHGVGLTKKAFLGRQLGPEGLALLKGVKRLFDPKNLFNPGKLLD
ncbi:MAG: FAD-binding protein [Aquificae bacterium]|nr:FAD-binding protein [Aquificota bacterium]